MISSSLKDLITNSYTFYFLLRADSLHLKPVWGTKEEVCVCVCVCVCVWLLFSLCENQFEFWT